MAKLAHRNKVCHSALEKSDGVLRLYTLSANGKRALGHMDKLAPCSARKQFGIIILPSLVSIRINRFNHKACRGVPYKLAHEAYWAVP